MIIDLTAKELDQAVTEFICKRGISPNSKFDIKYRAGRKGNPTTAKVGIDEVLVKPVDVVDGMDSDPLPEVSISSFEEVSEEDIPNINFTPEEPVEPPTAPVINIFAKGDTEEKEEPVVPKNPFKFSA